MANRFFTIMVIPEDTSKVRTITIRSWVLNGAMILLSVTTVLAVIMIADYWYVMNQIDQNKELKIDNRRLRQQVQVFENKMTAMDDTLNRIQTFSTRLKVITNITDQGTLIESLNRKLPEASTNVGGPVDADKAGSEKKKPFSELTLLDNRDPERVHLEMIQEELEYRLSDLHYEALITEQNLQDLYELLNDQKSFLAALPTRTPSLGRFSSGFGVRRSPFGGGIKMHEGLDIAGFGGTPIFATASGTVDYAGSKPGYGRTVILSHGYGLETWYGHCRQVLVKAGQKIRRGQRIALMGSSGRSTGTHVHYEVRVNGYPVDPLSYILEQ